MGLSYDESTDKLLGTPLSTPPSSRRGSDREALDRGAVLSIWSFLGSLWVWSKRHVKLVLTGVATLTIAITLLIYHLQPPPQAPYGWRDQCRADFPSHWILSNDPVPAERRIGVMGNDNPAWPYPGDEVPRPGDAETYEPVNVFIGIFTVAAAKEKRNIIRQTYRMQGKEGVKWVFVLGRPSWWGARALREEAELHGDIVFLPIKENTNKGKTYHFFRWAADHAVMDDSGTRPDYVMKADDDAFIMLDELEKRLRVTPRTLTYWGLLMWGSYRQQTFQGEYMSGGGYAMSFDLVQYIASSTYAAGHIKGNEDQVVGDWIRAHPEAENIVWVVERCWIYDHPRQTGWAMAHGFLFPNVVQHIRSSTEHVAGHLPPLPDSLQNSWSTVTDWLVPYFSPLSQVALTTAERIEAMVEGSPMSLLHPHNRRYTNDSNHPENLAPEPNVSAVLRLEENERVTRAQVQQAWQARPSMEQRMASYEVTGSTVYVHEVKQVAWWIEVGLALMGPNAWKGTGYDV